MHTEQEKQYNNIMLGKNELSRLFLLYMNDNYNMIKKSFKGDKLMKRILNDDLYQEGILKCAESINKNGIRWVHHSQSGQTFKNYLFISLKNLNDKQGRREEKILKDDNYLSESDFELIEGMVHDVEEGVENEYNRLDEDLLIEEIFQWVEGRYKPIHTGFFKFYFKTEYSYREIAVLTGYGVDTVFRHIARIKADVCIEFGNRRLPHRIMIKDDKIE